MASVAAQASVFEETSAADQYAVKELICSWNLCLQRASCADVNMHSCMINSGRLTCACCKLKSYP